MSDETSCENALYVIFKFSAQPWNTLQSSFVLGGGGVNSCASTTSWQTLLLEESNFLENVEKQMRKSRVKSPVVNNSRGQLGKSGGQLTCAMQDTLCSNSPHLFFMTHIFLILPLISYPDLALSQAVGDLGTRLPIPFSLSLPRSRFLDVTHKNGCEGDYFSLTLSIIYEYHFYYNESCIVLVSNHQCYQMLFKVGAYLLPGKITTVL